MAANTYDSLIVYGFIRSCVQNFIAEDIANIIIEYHSYHTIIIDNGSAIMKVGFAGRKEPARTFPSVVGRTRPASVATQSQCVFGDAALVQGNRLIMRYPIEHGIVTNWSDLEDIWHHTFYDVLKIDPSKCHVLSTENPIGPKANREKMTQIMFETFKVRGLYVALSEVLALYGTGRSTGVVMDSGDGVTHAVPIYEGYALPHAIQRLDLGGRDVTAYLKNLLLVRYTESFLSLSASKNGELGLFNDIKQRCGYIAADLAAENEKQIAEIETKYTMPDGKTLTLHRERYQAPECIFDPSVIAREDVGVAGLVYSCIMKCDVDIRAEFYRGIVLTGGNTMFDGFPQRLSNELQAKTNLKLKIYAPDDRQHGIWRGGSILASLPSFESSWITRDEYEESGPSIVHRKCY